MRHRKWTELLVLALIVVTASASAAAGPGAGRSTRSSTVLQDSEAAFEVQSELPDGRMRSLSAERLGTDPTREEWAVSMTTGTGPGFSAWLVASSDRVVVTGFADDMPFLYSARIIAPDVVAETRRFGNSYFSGEFNLANTADARNTRWAGQFRRFTMAASQQSGWGIINEMTHDLPELLTNSSYPTSVGLATKIALGATGALPTPMSVYSYNECLRIACGQDGGCWSAMRNGGCHACPRDPFGVRVFSFILYTIDAELCFLEAFVTPAGPLIPDVPLGDNQVGVR